MIDENKYLQVVSQTKADITSFFDLALRQQDFRKILVKHLLENDSINIYYHTFLILKKATKTEPSLFYCYWDQFSSLLRFENSYHRNYGMDIIANLVTVDKDNKFELIIDDYYKQLYDDKISTVKYCIYNSASIFRAKTQLTTRVLTKIVDSLRVNENSEKQQNFLIAEFLKLLKSIDLDLTGSSALTLFLNDVLKNTKSEKIKREIQRIWHKNANSIKQ